MKSLGLFQRTPDLLLKAQKGMNEGGVELRQCPVEVMGLLSYHPLVLRLLAPLWSADTAGQARNIHLGLGCV